MRTQSKVEGGEFNAETQRTQRDAEKKSGVSGLKSKVFSAMLCGLCVSALIPGVLV